MKIKNLALICAKKKSYGLRNKNLRKILSEQKIKMILNLDQNKRPSELSPEIYYKITKLFEMK